MTDPNNSNDSIELPRLLGNNITRIWWDKPIYSTEPLQLPLSISYYKYEDDLKQMDDHIIYGLDLKEEIYSLKKAFHQLATNTKGKDDIREKVFKKHVDNFDVVYILLCIYEDDMDYTADITFGVNWLPSKNDHLQELLKRYKRLGGHKLLKTESGRRLGEDGFIYRKKVDYSGENDWDSLEKFGFTGVTITLAMLT